MPDLLAKPIIDIAIGVRTLEDISGWPAVLAPKGYVWFGDHEGRGDYFFAKGPDDCRTVYLHVVPIQSGRWIVILRFRDALRADPRRREQYARMKVCLCDAHPHDRGHYTAAKAAFICRILQGGPNH